MKSLIYALVSASLLFTGLAIKAQIPKLNSYPQATATIFLDFDGQTVSSPYWTAVPFYATPATLTTDQITRIFNQVAEDFRPFNLNITTDSTVFLAAIPGKRQRIIITDYSSWYGSAGGVAYNTSFRWSIDVPGFVFSNLLSTNPDPNINAKRVAEASSHETGHSLGLDHQKVYNASCALTSEYNPGIGTGEISWAPIMGNSYSRNLTLWHNGTTMSCSTFQDDLNVIAGSGNGFGLRTDDVANTTNSASNIILNGSSFGTNGFINSTDDIDVFRFTFTQNGRLVLNAVPYNVASGNQSANIDLEVDLLASNGTVINTYNPTTSVQAIIDSNLSAGTYFIRVSNIGNSYASNYGMVGSYSLNGSFQQGSALPIYDLKLSARITNEKHELGWNIIADEPIQTISLEVSSDGRNFTNMQDVNESVRRFVYQPFEKNTLYYRLHVITASQLKYYSNIVSLQSVKGNNKYNLVSNFINNSTIAINSNGTYNWRLIDLNGRIWSSGKMVNGYNRIDASSMNSGVYLLQIIDGTQVTTEKLVKQ